ncbi:hypothetical protein Tsp_09275 [Trichinella spiralis]|uniref:hypothetical protein n=1 Tax=Trichinella spiralis TaxID=6334 RepID=UPI0001EFC52F|nr:hypothetical protein Tsp_09275 [Trichinella spiralis]
MYMGSIDLNNMIAALYGIERKSRKWNRRIFFWITSTAIRSKRCLEQAQAQSFTCQVSQSLCLVNKPITASRATPAVTTNGKTTDQLTSQQKWQRIKLATGQKSHKFEEDADCGLHQPHACAINAVFTNA